MSQQISEADLVTRLQQGETMAYTAIFRKYYLPLCRFLARYLSAVETAEDVAQDVFFRLWEGRATLDPNRSLKAYLFASARNRALDLVAHQAVAQGYTARVLHEQGEDAERSPEYNADDTLAAEELLRLAEARVATLSPRLREVYHLSRYEGLSAAEIAEVLGTSVQTVYTQLAKVLQALHPVLRDWAGES